MHQYLMEDASILANDDTSGGYIIQEIDIDSHISGANNALFITKSKDYLDFSEHNPFSENDRF